MSFTVPPATLPSSQPATVEEPEDPQTRSTSISKSQTQTQTQHQKPKSQQIYDPVAPHYASVIAIPGTQIIYWMLSRFIRTTFPSPGEKKNNDDNQSNDNLSGKSILELACGTGDCSRAAHALGARDLVAIDVSSEMVKVALQIEREREISTGIVYHVADCSVSPIPTLAGREGTPFAGGNAGAGGFDLVMGNWLFSYARTREEVMGMMRNVHLYLKPGGIFIGAFTGFDVEAPGLKVGKYGAKGTVFENVVDGEKRDGVRISLEFHTMPVVVFDVWLLEREVYEEAALEVGFSNGLEVLGPSWEDLPEGQSGEFWEDEIRDPSNVMFVLRKG